MKNTIKLLGGALVAAVILFTSCGGSGDSPKAVAQKFITALEDKKWDDAAALGTEDTKKAVQMLQSFASMMPQDAKKKEYEFGEEKVDGDKATVSYKEKGTDKEQTVNLVKQDGKWLVSMSKDEMSGGGSSAPEAAPVDSAASVAPVDSAATAAPATK